MHLITDTALTVRDQLKSTRGLSATFVPPEETKLAILALEEAEAGMAALKLELLASAEDAAAAEGFHGVATWLAHHTRRRRSDAAADFAMAKALDRMPVLASALREATVNLDQARVIARTIGELPVDAGRDVVERAEAEWSGSPPSTTPRSSTCSGTASSSSLLQNASRPPKPASSPRWRSTPPSASD